MRTQTINLPMKDIAAFCKRYHVRELALFGSAAKGKLRKGSDIDLLVEFEHDAQVGFITLSRMQRELSDLIQRKVDLVPKGGLKPILQQEILPTIKVLYAA